MEVSIAGKTMSEITPSDDRVYQDFLQEVKTQIGQSRILAA
jgi:hypothetical protein